MGQEFSEYASNQQNSARYNDPNRDHMRIFNNNNNMERGGGYDRRRVGLDNGVNQRNNYGKTKRDRWLVDKDRYLQTQ